MTILGDLAPVASVLDRRHTLLEAPRFGKRGEIVYSDVLDGGLWMCAPDGVVAALLPKRRGIGGVVAHADGGWVLSGRSLVHVRADSTQRELLAGAETPWLDGETPCAFNDLASTPQGELLAGVLTYRPLAGEAERNGRLVRLEMDGTVRILSDQVIWPNGVGVSPDGRTIYLSDYARAVVLALDANGGSTREFARMPRGSADGLAVDREGGVWAALGEGGAIARFHADGRLDEVAQLPARFVSSLCFGGDDMRELLITTADNEVRPELGGTLLRARSEVAGLPLCPVAV